MRHLRGSLPRLLFAWLLPSLMLAAVAWAQESISDLESRVGRFTDDASEIYRFDADARDAIWDAYCGQLDPSSHDFGPDFAKEVAQGYQQRELDKVHKLLDQVNSLAELADRLQHSEDSDVKQKASDLVEKLRKEQRKLEDLDQGVVLKGSNHPFTQYAIDYGIQRHKDLCSSEGEEPRICDKTWPNLDGRPDLVFVNGDGLWIYEFKPNNAKAISAGEAQVKRYVDGVQKELQRFFPNGRAGGYQQVPDSDHKGEDFVKKLRDTPSAWSSDGSTLIIRTKVVTYNMCDKRF